MFHLLLIFLLQSSLVSEPATIPIDKENYTVYIFLSEECPICRYYVHEVNRLSDLYGSEKITFVAVFPNFSSKTDKIDAFANEYKLNIPTRTDYFKSLAKQLDAKLTPEVFVVNQNEEVVYRGRIDNAYVSLGNRRRVVTSTDLEDFLVNLQDGDVKYTQTQSIGCYIHYSDFN